MESGIKADFKKAAAEWKQQSVGQKCATVYIIFFQLLLLGLAVWFALSGAELIKNAELSDGERGLVAILLAIATAWCSVKLRVVFKTKEPKEGEDVR